MEQSEIVQVALNEYESSASLANTVTKTVKVGPKNIELAQKVADSLSTSSVNFSVNVSQNQLMSRRCVFEFPISITIDSGADGRNMRNVFLCPRADLNRIIQTLTVKCNSSSVTSRPGDYVESILAYSKEAEHYHNGGLLSSTPVVPDILYSNNLAQFTGTSTTTPDNTALAGMEAYHFRENAYDMSYPSRSVVAPFTKYGTTGIANQGTRSVGFTYFVRVALKNELFSLNAMECLGNIQQLDIQINFNSGYMREKLFHIAAPYCEVSGSELVIPVNSTSVKAQIGTLVATGTAPNQLYNFVLNNTDFKLLHYIINPLVEDIPETMIVPSSSSMLTFDYPVAGSIADNSDVNIVHTSINLQEIPSHFWLSCVPQETSLSILRSDYSLPLKNVNVNIALNLVSRINLMQNSVFVIQRGSPLRQISGVSQEEYASALAANSFISSAMDLETNETGDLMGGSNFSSLFKDAGRFLIRSLNIGNKLLQSAAEIYPDRVPYPLAYEANRANQFAQAANSQLGLGAGGSMMGGSRLDMLKASGLLK